ncbi:hypothetical protein Slin15195_G068970 [Septoria linicola]|uniref:Uncharacterized protein n=1 Tax=Septoria linicola TaxID=215465 RepID=A0A9Q9AWW6_9PEZI|nr:hypothetical protein Slin15195_G068970 [Septoria linicola]
MASTQEATDLIFPKATASYTCFKRPRIITTCDYIDARLNAAFQPSPGALLALVILKTACMDALELGITEQRQKYIRFCEAKIERQAWIRRALSSEDHAMMEDLVRMRWRQVFGLFDDYSSVCLDGGLSEKVRAWREEECRRPLLRLWETLANEVAAQKVVSMDAKSKDSRDLKAYWTFKDACAGAASYEEDMLDCIRTYASRSSTYSESSPSPNEIRDALAQCHWYTVANTIHKAIRDLDSVIPSTCEPEDRLLLKRYFYTLRDTWFSQVTFENSRTWVPKRVLVDEACWIREARDVAGREVDITFKMSIQDMDVPRCHPETNMKMPKGWTEECLGFAMIVEREWVVESREEEEMRDGVIWSVLEVQGK